MKKIDCLAFAPHPDDVELFCSGLLLKLKQQGRQTGIADLTRGELSSNGNPESRLKEAGCSSEILKLDYRINLGISDGNIENNLQNRLKVIQVIRTVKPDLVLVPYRKDRHPDHESASQLLKDSAFYSGLIKISTEQAAHRPKTILYYMLHREFKPSFCVDISDVMEEKIRAIRCFRSQFERGDSEKRKTYINDPQFMETIYHRAEYYGSLIGVRYAEAFYCDQMMKLDNIMEIFS